MLPYQSGRSQVEKFFVQENRKERYLQAVAGLPLKYRSVTERCLDYAQDLRPESLSDSDPLTELFSLNDRKLEQIFAVLFPGLEQAAARTWRSISTGPYCDFLTPNLYRSPGRADLTARKQLKWLHKTLSVFMNYDSVISTAESLAVWAPYLDTNELVFLEELGVTMDGDQASDHIGRLLASLIDIGGRTSQNVWDTLRLTIEERHPSSMFGGHVVRACWRCGHEEAYSLMEDRVRTSNDPRQMRSIVRGVSEANIEAVQSLLRCVLHNDLLTTPAVASELAAWWGFNGSPDKTAFSELVGSAIRSLSAPTVGSQTEWYGGLLNVWAGMIEDVEAAIGNLHRWLEHEDSEARLAAVLLAKSSAHAAAVPLLESAFADPDLLVATHAVFAKSTLDRMAGATSSDSGAAVRALLELYNKGLASKRKLKSITHVSSDDFFSKIASQLERYWTTESLSLMGKCFGHEKLAWLHFLPRDYVAPDEASVNLLLQLAEPAPADWGFERDIERIVANRVLLRSNLSHSACCTFIEKLHLDDTEMPALLIDSLSRTQGSVFENIIRTLLQGKKTAQRVAALRILLQSSNGPHYEICCRAASELDPAAKSKSEEEAKLLRHVKTTYEALNDANEHKTPAAKWFPDLPTSPPWSPSPKQPMRFTPACAELLKSLDSFLDEHSEPILKIAACLTPSERPKSLSQVRLDHYNRNLWESQLEPLLQKWLQIRPETTKDKDGLELARVATFFHKVFNDERVAQTIQAKQLDVSKLKSLETPDYNAIFPERFSADKERQPLNHPLYSDMSVLRQIVNWNLVWPIIKEIYSEHATWADFTYQLEMAEAICAAVPPQARDLASTSFDSRPDNVFDQSLPVASNWLRLPESLAAQLMPKEIAQHLFHLIRWMDFPRVHYGDLDRFAIETFARGAATLGDVAERLLSQPGELSYGGDWLTYRHFSDFRNRYQQRLPEWEQFTHRLASSLVASETNRKAQAITDLTPLACCIGYLEGYKFFESMLLATAKFGLTYPTGSETNYRNVLSRLLAAFHPSPEDDLKDAVKRLTGLLKNGHITQQHLLRAGFLAPQWLETISQALAWPRLREIQEWYYHHLSVYHRTGNPNLAAWLASSNEKFRHQMESSDPTFDIYTWYQQHLAKETSSNASGRPPTIDITETDQWVDDEWFQSIATPLDDKKWKLIHDAASVLSTPKYVAAVVALTDALRGRLNRKSLLAEIKATKKPLDVRLIALLPMEKGERRGPDLLERYRAIETYRTKAKKFYDDMKESALEMVAHTMVMLAARAGLASVEQLEWLVQTTAAVEFKEHQLFVLGDVEVRLAIDETGTPACNITKAGKRLKALPAAVKKNARCLQQQSVYKSLQKFSVEARNTVQQSMVDRHRYNRKDLSEMVLHPILGRIFESILFTDGNTVGLLIDGCTKLYSYDGKQTDLADQAELRIAHPTDLSAHGGWVRWRDWLRTLGRSQAIMQIERGCFLPAHFLEEGKLIEPLFRQQLDEDQAVAILRSYGWEGHNIQWMTRRFDAYQLMAETGKASCASFFASPFEANRIAKLTFQINNVPIPADEVPIIAFSEIIRELYLAAVTAQTEQKAGSTFEHRQRAINRLIQSEKLTNTRWDRSTLVIDGHIGSYVADVHTCALHMLPSQHLPLAHFAPATISRKSPKSKDKPDAELANLLRAITILANDSKIDCPQLGRVIMGEA